MDAAIRSNDERRARSAHGAAETEHQKKLEQYRKNAQSHREKIDAARASLVDADRLDELRQEVEIARDELTKFDAELSIQQQTARDANAQASRLKQEYEILRKRVERSKETLGLASKQRFDAATKKKAAQTERSAASATLQAAKEEIRFERSRLDHANSELAHAASLETESSAKLAETIREAARHRRRHLLEAQQLHGRELADAKAAEVERISTLREEALKDFASQAQALRESAIGQARRKAAAANKVTVGEFKEFAERRTEHAVAEAQQAAEIRLDEALVPTPEELAYLEAMEADEKQAQRIESIDEMELPDLPLNSIPELAFLSMAAPRKSVQQAASLANTSRAEPEFHQGATKLIAGQTQEADAKTQLQQNGKDVR